MTLPSLVVLFALLIPVFVGTWTVSVLALSIQAACGAWIGMHHEFDPSHAGSWVALGDAALRVVLGPVLLWSLPRKTRRGFHFELVPVNMGHWMAVGALMFLALSLGRQIEAVDAQAPGAAIMATSACVLFSFFVLSVQSHIASQAVAILILENGIFLFENSLEHHLPTAIQLGLSAVYALTLVCFRYALTVTTTEGLHS